MTQTLLTQLAPAYNAFLAKHPRDESKPMTAERFQRLLEDAVARHVSDIHIDPGTDGYRIRFRLDGALHNVATLGRSGGERLIRFLAAHAELDVPKPFEPQEGRASFDVSGEAWELRFCAVPAALGEKVTMRLLGANQIGKLGLASMQKILTA
ncbi:MAG: type II secretory ATPase GspE/PulE/Tfp pilus assembly ATPase PilB-like protein [Verrucomicrobiales bacterium]|jgi:type II secretory ATPase GspE/PulE/Tfp pilus assembly ATPase PilB-like protein